jgi:uncharacterized protein YfaS (alpha-2-macroglobulin family)
MAESPAAGSHEGSQLAVAYRGGTLTVTVPYDAVHAGAGELAVEVLDPEDRVLGSSERELSLSHDSGTLQQTLVLKTPVSLDALVWERVHYRFVYKGETDAAFEGTRSVSEILRRPVVHVLGQRAYLAGGKAAIRLIVLDANNNTVLGRGSVRIELVDGKKEPTILFKGSLNRHGTTQAEFQLPAGLLGHYELHYVVDTTIGSTDCAQGIEIEEKASILLTTEKPIYQPSQTIHIRALALDKGDHVATSDRTLTFEVEDSRGNKVFKKVTHTDGFGIASAEFALADEVNLGTYHVRALLGASDSPASTAELSVNVQRYVLPKFKVAIDFAEKDHKPKRDYRPGEHVTGTVRANYFFGKPVEGADIRVKASSMDVSVFEASDVSGKADKDGTYHFDLKLPDYFAGRPLNQGSARVLIEATVKDSTEHSESRGEPITVSHSSLLITAIPEGGNLIPKLDNEVFLLTSYPDGTPAKTQLTYHFDMSSEEKASTDPGGVAIVRVKGMGGHDTLHVEADDHRGNRASSEIRLESRSGEDQILLRLERAVYRTGDRIELDVFSTRAKGSAYVDMVKEGQTILTRDLDIENGHARLTLIATPEMSGTLDLNAYLFGRDAQPVGDHRMVFVQPADELKIETAADLVAYKPGAEAKIHFRITNAHGEGVQAALGLQVVDEAVFALAEKEPGFAKVFFYLEQEVMKPRYEIHSISMNDVVQAEDHKLVEQREDAARALFSATEMVNTNRLQTEFGKDVPMAKYDEYNHRYQAAFLEHVRRLAAQMDKKYAGHPSRAKFAKEVMQDFRDLRNEDGTGPHDAWGTPLDIRPTGWVQGSNKYYLIRSAGPDQRIDTADDLRAYMEIRIRGDVPSSGTSLNSGKVGMRIESDRGPFNGRANLTGTVMDQSGAVVPGASVVLGHPGGDDRKTESNALGQFNFSAVPPGKYEIHISSSGFLMASEKFEVKARDRATLDVTLSVGSSSTIVAVTAEAAMPVPTPMARPVMAMGRATVGAAFKNREMAVDTVTINSALVQDLPIENRDVSQLVGIAPGVAANRVEDAHVRSYFPEALYINPEILTDGNGEASITIPIADSITTWRMAMLASTQSGALGTSTSSLKVFQDFFVDLDLPVTLTQGDRVSIPVAVYNYAGARGDVSLRLEPADWYSLVNDEADKSLRVDSGQPGASQFTLEAKRIGKFKLTLSAGMLGSEKREDIVVREIEVVPNGREKTIVFNGHLDTEVKHTVAFPASAIPEASKIFVRLYPGPLSQVIEGMDSILRMPGGCFEQTSSSTYPNVLALDYMKRTKKLTPEVHAKAEGYIANGYQRLLTFEVPGGGFSWFGEAPANKILTAYGLMEFSDMAKVFEVDPRLIERTQQWLASQQQADGSWKLDSSFINEGATNRYNSDVLRITVYLAWSLENTGYKGEAVERAKHYIEQHLSEGDGKIDVYTLAVLGNFAADYVKDREFTRKVMERLLDARIESGDSVSWNAEETGVYSTGTSAAIETTGLAVQALLKWGEAAPTVRKGLNFITSKKDASGGWGTTQATIMALRAVLLASEIGRSDAHGTVEIALNGNVVQSLAITGENNDLLHQFVLKGIDPSAASEVQIRFTGTGGLGYQVAGSYFVPWEAKQQQEALSIDVTYDRTKLAQNDIATSRATVKSNLDKRANMVMVDLGIPPGFELLSEDLQAFQEKTAGQRSGKLEKFSQTATQAILYFDALAAHETVTIQYRLRAKYPIRARSFESRVYEYYDPAVTASASPAQLEVHER